MARLKGSSQKARRARILLKVDADGPGWTDQRAADAFDCRVRTVENLRRQCVLESGDLALHGRKRGPKVPRQLLDGQQGRAVDRAALGASSEGLRPMVAAAAGPAGGGAADHACDQSHDGGHHAETNGITGRSLQYCGCCPLP